MKKILAFSSLLLTLQAHAESVGKVVFFNTTSTGITNEEPNVDFYFYYDKLNNILTKQGFKVFLVEKLPVTIEAQHDTIELEKSDLKSNSGVIFVKPSGAYIISPGIKTDVDVLMEVEKYFGTHHIGE